MVRLKSWAVSIVVVRCIRIAQTAVRFCHGPPDKHEELVLRGKGDLGLILLGETPRSSFVKLRMVRTVEPSVSGSFKIKE